MKKSIWFHITQIVMLLVAGLGLTTAVGLAVFVFPKLQQDLMERALDVPRLTLVSMQVARFGHAWWWLLVGLLVAIAILGHALPSPEKRADLRGLGLALLALVLVAVGLLMTLGALYALMRLAGII